MPDTETIDAVTSILTGLPAEEPATEAQSPEVEPEAQEPEPEEIPADDAQPAAETLPAELTIKELAEKLGTRPQDLYGKVMIDVGGDTMSLSELKDRGKDLYKADKVLTDAESHRADTENELMRKQRAHAVATGGREYSEQEVKAADKQWNDYAKGEDRKLKNAIGGWADPAQQTADEESMTSLLAEYGFSEVEAGAIKDYRLRKQLHDFAQLKGRLEKATETEVKVTRKQSSRGQQKAATKGLGDQAIAAHGRKEISTEKAVMAILAEGTRK